MFAEQCIYSYSEKKTTTLHLQYVIIYKFRSLISFRFFHAMMIESCTKVEDDENDMIYLDHVLPICAKRYWAEWRWFRIHFGSRIIYAIVFHRWRLFHGNCFDETEVAVVIIKHEPLNSLILIIVLLTVNFAMKVYLKHILDALFEDTFGREYCDYLFRCWYLEK